VTVNEVRTETRRLADRLAAANGKWTKPRFPYHSEGFAKKVAAGDMAATSNAIHDIPIDVVASWMRLGEEIYRQYDQIQKFIDIEVIDVDPYADYRALRMDLDAGKLKVWHSVHTGGHPGWSDDMNNRFRAVHDVMGHYRNDVDFSVNGEDAAYRGHAETVPDLALPALSIETRGQTSAFWYADPVMVFKEQKLYLPPAWVYRTYGWEFPF
jgi:hypothetical protein